MKLYLVRHGEALPPTSDPKQPLSASGKKEVELMARFLAEKKISFDAIFHSPKLRAKQTAELIASKAAPHLSLQEKEGLKPNDPIEPFLSEILHEEGSLLLAGHLPFITSLISYLLFRKDTPLFLNLCAASVTCLMRVENSWIIDWHVTPQLL